MQGTHLFEYAIIRVVPRVEREEFLNVGVILYCPGKKFLQCMFTLDEERLKAFSPHIDIEELREHLCALQQICHGGTNGGPIGKLDDASRFRWLTATRSTIVQSSKVHPGLCDDPAETLSRLHAKMVLND
jgi:Protein of unknown function (DUF3037).